MDFKDIRYIAVDGPIGAGKSTLARIMAEDLGGQLLLESPDENPFLPMFYEEPARYAFQTQLFFLLSRYNQHKFLENDNPFEGLFVCDYNFAKDLIFAKINLTEAEYQLYAHIYQMIGQKLPKPDVVVFLQADSDVLMERIGKRNKDYEDIIEPEYVQKVSQAYSEYYFQYTETPLLVVNTSNLDLVKQKKGYEMLKHELVNLVESGQPKLYVTIEQQ